MCARARACVVGGGGVSLSFWGLEGDIVVLVEEDRVTPTTSMLHLPAWLLYIYIYIDMYVWWMTYDVCYLGSYARSNSRCADTILFNGG